MLKLIACRSVANSKAADSADLANSVPPEHMRRREVRLNPMRHERRARAMARHLTDRILYDELTFLNWIDLGSCRLAGTLIVHNRFNSSRLCRISLRARFCSARCSAEYRPCFQRSPRDLASPSGVRGPVLAPPCLQHLPWRIAGPAADERNCADLTRIIPVVVLQARHLLASFRNFPSRRPRGPHLRL